jgi:hypothetical protein
VPEAGRVPALPAGAGDAAGVPVAQDRIDRFAVDQPGCGLPDRGSFGWDVVDAVDGEPERPLAAVGFAVAGEFLMLELQTLGLVLGLIAGVEAPLGEEPAPHRGGQVVLSGDGGELGAVVVGEVDDVGRLPQLSGEAVGVPGDDGVDPARLDVLQHPLIRGPPCPAERAQVVVDVQGAALGVGAGVDVPAQPLAQVPAGRELPLNPESLLVAVDPHAGDAGVDAGSGWHVAD